MKRFLLLLAAFPIVAAVAAPARSGQPAGAPVDFNRDVLPILSNHCFQCHGPDAPARKAKLRLDTRDGLYRVRDGVAVVVPGKTADSELFRRVTSTDDDEIMPPPRVNKKLTEKQIDTLRRWIEQGAPWARHWAFEPPQRPRMPAVKNAAWVRNGIDAFVLERLEKEGLSPSPEAAKEVLLRRVTLDLTGLPPTPAEVDAFLANNSPTAYEEVVDRLLASPRYGERMAWDWLDAARYADSNGYQGDQDRTMWPWRDWVVSAFNANMPFDQFTVEQLAGDLLSNATRDQKLATAFNRNHMINGEGGRIPEENRIEYLVDQTDTVSTIWLGATLGCARCHDHKFDPFTMRDYYSLLAYFNQTPVTGGGGSGKTPPVLDFATPEQDRQRVKLQKELDELLKQVRAKETKLREAGLVKENGKEVNTLPASIESTLRKGPGDRNDPTYGELVKFYKDKEPDYVALLQAHKKARQARDSFVNSIPQVMVMEDMAKPRDTFVLLRGAYDKKGEKVSAEVPAALLPAAKGAPKNRLGLAQWLVDPGHPLTARVTVNRHWQTFFGAGLVRTVEEFGAQGERPSHPELLDWLASEFVRSGWDVKALQRLIVTSATYRQSSKMTPALRERDPNNRLLARAGRFRLPSWMIRDQALAAGGLLVEKVGGPPVRPYQPAGVWEEATFGFIKYKQDHGPDLYRRSLYVFWRRIVGPTLFFDSATRQVCAVKSVRTNTPLHALTTLNDTTFVEAARVLAERVMQVESRTENRLAAVFRRTLTRPPRADELKILSETYDRLHAKFAADPAAAEKLLAAGEWPRDPRLNTTDHAALAAVCSLVLNLDEALTRQ
jgi:hypothetical protein